MGGVSFVTHLTRPPVQQSQRSRKAKRRGQEKRRGPLRPPPLVVRNRRALPAKSLDGNVVGYDLLLGRPRQYVGFINSYFLDPRASITDVSAADQQAQRQTCQRHLRQFHFVPSLD